MGAAVLNTLAANLEDLASLYSSDLVGPKAKARARGILFLYPLGRNRSWPQPEDFSTLRYHNSTFGGIRHPVYDTLSPII
jgi:hypothetical protein